MSLVRLTETLAATRDGIVPLGTTAAGMLSGQVPAMAFIEVIGGMPGDAEGFTNAAGRCQSRQMLALGAVPVIIAPAEQDIALREPGLEAQAFSVMHLLSPQEAAGNAMRQGEVRIHGPTDKGLAGFRTAVRPVFDTIAAAAADPLATASEADCDLAPMRGSAYARRQPAARDDVGRRPS